MKSKLALSRDAQLALRFASVALLAVWAVFDRGMLACAMEKIVGVIVVSRSAAERRSSVCWSEAG